MLIRAPSSVLSSGVRLFGLHSAIKKAKYNNRLIDALQVNGTVDDPTLKKPYAKGFLPAALERESSPFGPPINHSARTLRPTHISHLGRSVRSTVRVSLISCVTPGLKAPRPKRRRMTRCRRRSVTPARQPGASPAR